MENYVFVCIGTNRLIEDSFGPRVGNILKYNFYNNPKIKVFGTMSCPIHFQNAPIFADYFKQEKCQLILIDSALGEAEQIGDTYINLGGIEIGKAFGKSFYVPAHLNIKTVVGLKPNVEFCEVEPKHLVKEINKIEEKEQLIRVNKLAKKLATQITYSVCAVI